MRNNEKRMIACENLSWLWFCKKCSDLVRWKWKRRRKKSEKKPQNWHKKLMNEWNKEPFLMFNVQFTLVAPYLRCAGFCSSSAFIVILLGCIVSFHLLPDNEWIFWCGWVPSVCVCESMSSLCMCWPLTTI